MRHYKLLSNVYRRRIDKVSEYSFLSDVERIIKRSEKWGEVPFESPDDVERIYEIGGEGGIVLKLYKEGSRIGFNFFTFEIDEETLYHVDGMGAITLAGFDESREPFLSLNQDLGDLIRVANDCVNLEKLRHFHSGR